MPTGYTAAVATGDVTDLRSFALQCARGMGALIMMRDLPSDAPVPEKFEPGTYNAERLKEAEARLAEIEAMDAPAAEAAADAEYQEQRQRNEEYLARGKAERARYEAMIAKVDAWHGAPEGLKPFMLEQLHRGMEFDCPTDRTPLYKDPPMTGPEWKASQLRKLRRDVSYHREEDAKERARTAERNAWVAQLHGALKEAGEPA